MEIKIEGKIYEFIVQNDKQASDLGCKGCAFNPTPESNICDCQNDIDDSCLDDIGVWKLKDTENE